VRKYLRGQHHWDAAVVTHMIWPWCSQRSMPTWCNADGKSGGELTAAGVSQRS
jgi:hypothetical protein